MVLPEMVSLVLTALFFNGAAAQEAPSKRFQERVIERVPKKYSRFGTVTYDPNGNRAAYWARTGGKWTVVLAGKPGRTFDFPGIAPIFSPDGKSLAYIGKKGRRWVVVLNERIVGDYAWAAYTTFRSDSKSLAFAAAQNLGKQKDVWFIQEEDQRVGLKQEFDGVAFPAYLPEGGKLSYLARREGQWFVVVDGKLHGDKLDLDAAAPPSFSKDGKRMLYAGKRGANWFLVMDGKKIPTVGKIDRGLYPVLSGDGKHLAYAAFTSKGSFVVFGSKKGPAFEGVGIPAIGPGGKSIAYLAVANKRGFVVVGDKRTEAYDQVGNPIYSSDGRSIAFGAVRGRDILWRVVRIDDLRKKASAPLAPTPEEVAARRKKEKEANTRREKAASHTEFARGELRKGRIEDALRHLDRSLRLNPDLMKSRAARGLLFYRSGEIKNAITDYAVIARMRPNFEGLSADWMFPPTGPTGRDVDKARMIYAKATKSTGRSPSLPSMSPTMKACANFGRRSFSLSS